MHLLLNIVCVCSVWNCKPPSHSFSDKHGFIKYLPAFQQNCVVFRKKGNPRIIMHIYRGELGTQHEVKVTTLQYVTGKTIELFSCGAGGGGHSQLASCACFCARQLFKQTLYFSGHVFLSSGLSNSL